MDKFKVEVQSRFRQSDSAGILFFAEIFNLAHDAYEEWVQQLGFSYSEWFENSKWAVPLVHCSADFKRPIRAGTTLSVCAELIETSAKSFTVRWSFLSTEQTLAFCSTKHTFVDKGTFKSMEIPPEVLTALQKFQQ